MKTLYPSTGRRAKTIDAANSLIPFPVRPLLNPMQTNELQALMGKLELLIDRVEQLKRQNGLLLAQEKTWREERAHLIEKNEIARRKVESMISRLKALEQDS
jgi:cell division protein ZapB